jgi:uncharacterized protein YjiS (DUF1127 family)
MLFYHGEGQPCKICSSLFCAVQLYRAGKKQTINHRSTDQLKGDHPMFEVLKSRISNWKRYNRTVTELQALTNRELADLGIARGDIQRVAREAARTA